MLKTIIHHSLSILDLLRQLDLFFPTAVQALHVIHAWYKRFACLDSCSVKSANFAGIECTRSNIEAAKRGRSFRRARFFHGRTRNVTARGFFF